MGTYEARNGLPAFATKVGAGGEDRTHSSPAYGAGALPSVLHQRKCFLIAHHYCLRTQVWLFGDGCPHD